MSANIARPISGVAPAFPANVGEPVGAFDIARAEDGVRQMLGALGFDTTREGLKGTPRRVVAALREMTAGYGVDVAALLKVDFGVESYGDIAYLRNIEFSSTCEHHLLPFRGVVHVAYLPSGDRVVGLSKLARLVEAYARRLQLQERMTHQIADALMAGLTPRGAAVIVEAEHQCMACRGVNKPGATMGTSSLRGTFMDSQPARDEVFKLLLRGERA